MGNHCHTCGAALVADGLRSELGVANCGKCGGVGLAQERTPPMAGAPRGITVENRHSNYRISWRMPKVADVAWGFLGGGMIALLVACRENLRPPWEMFHVVTFAFGVVCLLAIYRMVACLVNRTSIHIDPRGTLTVCFGPLPWRRDRSILRDNLSGLFSRQFVSRSNRGVSYSYSLVAIDADGDDITLISGFSDRWPLTWLIARLQERLGFD